MTGLVALLLLVVLQGVPEPTGGDIGTALVSGQATWYCDPPASPCTRGYGPGRLVAAAGRELQFAGWRGSWVTVHRGGRRVTVQLVDVCACPGSRVIDLYAVAFRKLAPQGAGVIDVEVELDSEPGPAPTLPATDTAP